MRIPILSYQEVIKALNKAGFKVVGGKRGHTRLKKLDPSYGHPLIVIVPRKKKIARGTLSSILRQTGLTREEFLELI